MDPNRKKERKSKPITTKKASPSRKKERTPPKSYYLKRNFFEKRDKKKLSTTSTSSNTSNTSNTGGEKSPKPGNPFERSKSISNLKRSNLKQRPAVNRGSHLESLKKIRRLEHDTIKQFDNFSKRISSTETGILGVKKKYEELEKKINAGNGNEKKESGFEKKIESNTQNLEKIESEQKKLEKETNELSKKIEELKESSSNEKNIKENVEKNKTEIEDLKKKIDFFRDIISSQKNGGEGGEKNNIDPSLNLEINEKIEKINQKLLEIEKKKFKETNENQSLDFTLTLESNKQKVEKLLKKVEDMDKKLETISEIPDTNKKSIEELNNKLNEFSKTSTSVESNSSEPPATKEILNDFEKLKKRVDEIEVKKEISEVGVEMVEIKELKVLMEKNTKKINLLFEKLEKGDKVILENQGDHTTPSQSANVSDERVQDLLKKLEESTNREEEYNQLVLSLTGTVKELTGKFLLFQKEFEVFKDLNSIEFNTINNAILSNIKKTNQKIKRIKGKMFDSKSAVDLEDRMKKIESTSNLQGLDDSINENEKVEKRISRIEKRMKKIGSKKFLERIKQIEKTLKAKRFRKTSNHDSEDDEFTSEEDKLDTSTESLNSPEKSKKINSPMTPHSVFKKRLHLLEKTENRGSVMELSDDSAEENEEKKKKPKPTNSIRKSQRTESVNWSDEEGFDFEDLRKMVKKKSSSDVDEDNFSEVEKETILQNLNEKSKAETIIPGSVLNSLLNDNTVVREGWLHKEIDVGNKKKWKKRFFRLYANKTFKFFLKKSDKMPLGMIKLEKDNIKIFETQEKKKKQHCITLQVVDIQKNYYLAAPSEKVMKSWFSSLKNHLS